MLGFTGGWKKKALILRDTLLSVGHQPAKELPTFLGDMLDLYREAAQTGDLTKLQDLIQRGDDGSSKQILWEPSSIYGWDIKATFYRKEGKLWWLFHAMRKSEREPSQNDVVMLEKVLDILGCQPLRDVVIGPRSNCASDGLLAFGWWTWMNRFPINEIQVNKHKTGRDVMRIVPLGTRPNDGYESVDLSHGAVPEDDATGE